LGISAGFLGMVLGWSLQAPVTGIAAWLMLILKRPFKIGDRVIIAGITGDVMDITLTHVILNQVGGTVSSEERSGRGILIPNAILFGQTITNYTLEEEYILVEVPVRITFESKWEEAEQILVDAATVVTADVIKETGEEPFIRAELFDAGVMMRLRYKTRPVDRAKSLSDIVKIVFHGFSESKTVEFCYAHSEIIYSWKDQPALPADLSEE
jgi:small-conductance mechanosensitive channel